MPRSRLVCSEFWRFAFDPDETFRSGKKRGLRLEGLCPGIYPSKIFTNGCILALFGYGSFFEFADLEKCTAQLVEIDNLLARHSRRVVGWQRNRGILSTKLAGDGFFPNIWHFTIYRATIQALGLAAAALLE